MACCVKYECIYYASVDQRWAKYGPLAETDQRKYISDHVHYPDTTVLFHMRHKK